MSTIEERVYQLLDDPRDSWRRIDILLARTLDELRERVAVLEQRADRSQGLTVDIQHYLALDERSEGLRVRVENLEKQVQHLMEEPDPNWERLLDRVERLEKRLDLSEGSTAKWDDPTPDTGTDDLLTMVRARAIDPMFRALYGQGELNALHRLGPNHYAKVAVRAVTDWLEDLGYYAAADDLRAQLER